MSEDGMEDDGGGEEVLMRVIYYELSIFTI
jgi:hypothetical protein